MRCFILALLSRVCIILFFLLFSYGYKMWVFYPIIFSIIIQRCWTHFDVSSSMSSSSSSESYLKKRSSVYFAPVLDPVQRRNVDNEKDNIVKGSSKTKYKSPQGHKKQIEPILDNDNDMNTKLAGHKKRPSRRNLPDEEGLPIEIPSSTLAPTTTPILPPLNPRYRRIFDADETASVDEFPFVAALLMNKELWCGAAIIDNDKVITAAHCLQLQYNNRFFREYVRMLTVRVGSTNATAGGDVYRVADIFYHPNYKPETLEFNIAILVLHQNISFGIGGPVVEKIGYYKSNVIPADNKILFLGWGAVLHPTGHGGQALLQKVLLPIYDQADCQEVYGKELVTHTNLCAGFISGRKNVCNHDAGGPAIMDGVLVGVLSFSSKRCDLPDQPAVFTNVGSVSNWITSVFERPQKRL